MVEIAKTLSTGMFFCRVDLYSLPEIKFGEITCYPGNGQEVFDPLIWDENFGELIKISKNQ